MDGPYNLLNFRIIRKIPVVNDCYSKYRPILSTVLLLAIVTVSWSATAAVMTDHHEAGLFAPLAEDTEEKESNAFDEWNRPLSEEEKDIHATEAMSEVIEIIPITDILLYHGDVPTPPPKA